MKKLLAVLFFFFCVAVYAQDPVGQVLVSSGEVFAVNATGERRALVRGDAVFEQDTLITQAGKAQVRFMDSALFTLHPNTEFKVKQYVFEPEKKASWVELVKGGLRTATGLIAKESPESYKIDTPVATIGVRGTTFWLTFIGNILEIFREMGVGQNVVVVLPNGLSAILNNQRLCVRVVAGSFRECERPRPGRFMDFSDRPTTLLCPVDVL